MKNIKKFVLNKRYFWTLIFISAIIGTTLLMVGSLTKHWSVRPDYLWLFYTFQSNFIITIYYGILIILMFSNSQYFQQYSNLKARQYMGVYMSLLMISILIIFGPIELFESWGIGPGAFPEVMSNQVINESNNIDITHYNVPGIIENIFVHVLTPILVMIDLLVLSEQEKKYKIEHQNDKSNLLVVIFPMFYITLMFSVGYTNTDTIILNGIEQTFYLLPYTIFSTDYFEIWEIILFTLAEVIFFLISCLIIFKDKNFFQNLSHVFKK